MNSNNDAAMKLDKLCEQAYALKHYIWAAYESDEVGDENIYCAVDSLLCAVEAVLRELDLPTNINREYIKLAAENNLRK